MSDDIVARLREAGECPKQVRVYVTRTVVLQAADEIERLRKELNTRIAMCDMRSEKIIELNDEIEWMRELLGNPEQLRDLTKKLDECKALKAEVEKAKEIN